MRFGKLALEHAQGAILAHSVKAGDLRLRKGLVLGASEIAQLNAAGIETVVAAQLDPGDLDENSAAQMISDQLTSENFTASAPFTGRVNFFAATAGVLEVDVRSVDALNAVDEAITLATLKSMSRVEAGAMIGTVKIIPYGVAKRSLEAVQLRDALRLHPFKLKTATLVLTKTDALSDKALNKGAEVISRRVASLGLDLTDIVTVPHEIDALSEALKTATGEMILILGASATSDRADICPMGLVTAGGEVTRFGMPVDPGNLLFLGALDGRPVVGLPGCARSPVLNGADWVLERLVAGLDLDGSMIAGMGVGGLLKENPTRPQPRRAKPEAKSAQIEVILLGAGASSRMGERDKLLEEVNGMPILRHLAREVIGSKAAELHVVLRPKDAEREAALEGLDFNRVPSLNWKDGMSASIRAGLKALRPGCDAALIMLADMPDIESTHIDQLIAEYDPKAGREIVRAVSPSGQPGHPVLFGRRFFESLASLTGDRGARTLFGEVQDFTYDVPLPGRTALTDLDTPEAWAAWRSARKA